MHFGNHNGKDGDLIEC